MQTINHRWRLARFRAARYEHPALDVPAYVRKHLVPRVQIGILRDPAQPIQIHPAIHTPEVASRDWDLWIAGLASVATLLLIWSGV